ncbi:MAG: hypothetical protein ACI38Q_03270 [Candidatus Bruticola sp.]
MNNHSDSVWKVLSTLSLRCLNAHKLAEIRHTGLTLLKKERGGSAIIMSIFIITIMMILAATYLMSLQTERHFSAVQERRLQAWYLAESGRDYFLNYCSIGSADTLLAAPGNTLKATQPGEHGELILAKVCVPEYSANYYFEISSLKPNVICVRGVVYDTLSSSGQPACLEKKIYLTGSFSKGWGNAFYDKLAEENEI